MIDIKKELYELRERLAELEAKVKADAEPKPKITRLERLRENVKADAEPKPKITRLERLRENVAARISSFDFETIWTRGVNSGLSVALSIIDAAIAEERAPKGKAPGRDCDSCNFNDLRIACKGCDVNGSMWMPRKPEPVKPAPAFEEHDLYIYDDARPLPAKPEPGDVVLYRGSPKSPWRLWMFEAGGYGIAEYIVLVRAADVRAAIGEGIRKGIEAEHETH